MRDLFNVINSLSGDMNVRIFPENISVELLPEKFALYFDSKIEKIRDGLIGDGLVLTDQETSESSLLDDGVGLEEFQTIGTTQLKEQFKDMNKKYCIGDGSVFTGQETSESLVLDLILAFLKTIS